MKNGYVPAPLDTSAVELPESIAALVEELSKNTHEVWSATRIAQGWSYGETRCDAEKLHPCLIPSEELPESEKEFDRNTSVETIKCILALGYTIEKKAD